MTIAHPLRTGAGPRAADHTARTTPSGAAGVASFVAAEGAGAERTGTLAARTWAADAALGAGLVLFALGAEHLGDHLVIAAVLITWAAAETLWAVLALRGPVPLPRSALAVLLVGVVGLFLVGSSANIIALNGADNVLHFASAVLLLGVGLGADRAASTPAGTRTA